MSTGQIRSLLRRATGLDLSDTIVDKAVERRMRQRQTTDHLAYQAEVARREEELSALIDLVVVPETWFFRDAETFASAARFTADKLAEGTCPVRVLSVPCASGEEPYSIAIALLDAGIPPASFSIDAVDVSPQVLQRARGGVYQGNAFRSRNLAFRDRHFTKHSNGYMLDPGIRQLVQFRCANLLALNAPPTGQGFDIVFCRNLLIYFDQATQAIAIRKLQTLLKDDGLLFSGYAETATFCLHGFTHVPSLKSFALRKKTANETSKPAREKVLTDTGPRKAREPRAASLRPPAKGSAPPAPGQLQTPAKDPNALLENANRLANQGSIDDANAAYLAYLQLVPDSAEAHFMLGLLCEHRLNDGNAEEYLRRAVYLDPDHYEALCHLALLADRRGNTAAAHGFRQRAARVYSRQSGEQAR